MYIEKKEKSCACSVRQIGTAWTAPVKYNKKLLLAAITRKVHV